MSEAAPPQADPNRPLATRLPFFYGWVVVGVIFLRAFTTGGALWTTGILSVPMHEDLGWSRTIIFAGITLRTLGAAVAAFFFGKYLDRTGGARIMAFASAVVASVCMLGVAFVQEQWQFLLVFGVIGGVFGAGPAQLLMGAIVPKWFIRQRGRAVATATMGTGLAAFILPPVIAGVNAHFGWREAWFFLGAVTVVISVLPALLLHTRPEDVNLLPDGEVEPSRVPGQSPARRPAREQSFTRAEALKTKTLWLLVLVSMFGMVSPTAFPTNLVPALVERGFSESTAAISFSAYGLTSFTGRFFWGWLADKLHIRKTLLIICTYTGMTSRCCCSCPATRLWLRARSQGSASVAGSGSIRWCGPRTLVGRTSAPLSAPCGRSSRCPAPRGLCISRRWRRRSIATRPAS